MDDQERQPTTQSAQQERDKGAAMEYDAGDEDALAQPTPPPGRGDAPQQKEK